MQLIEAHSEGLKHEFTVTLPAETIMAKAEARLAEISRTARIPGFRPGKVPMTLVRKRYGPTVRSEVIVASVQESAAQVLREYNLRPALEPRIRITEGEDAQKDIVFTVALEALPALPAIDFTALHLEQLKAEVTDQALGEALERLAASFQNRQTIAEDRPVPRLGDVAVVDVTGTVAGMTVPDITRSDFPVELGRNGFVPGFDNAILGAKVGDTLDFTLTLPESRADDLAGKTVAFAVAVKALQEIGTASIDDTLARGYGMENLEALRNAVRKELEQGYATRARARLKRVLLDRLAADHIFEVPSEMCGMEFNTLWQQVLEAKAKGELDSDEMAKDEEALQAEYQAVAERRIRLGLILGEIGHVHDITLTQTDVVQALEEKTRGIPLQIQRKLLEYYRKEPKALNVLKMSIFEDKVVDFVIARASITEKVVAAEELFRDPDDPLAET